MVAVGVFLPFVWMDRRLNLFMTAAFDLRPFNFDTLATRAFQLATDEQLARSAVPALLIIAVGLVPVILLNKLIGSGSGESSGLGRS